MIVQLGDRREWHWTGHHYAQVTHTICPFCREQGALLLYGDSHDDEPMMGQGTYCCQSCGEAGKWDSCMVPGVDYYVGQSGIAVPSAIDLLGKRIADGSFLHTRQQKAAD